MTARIRRGLVMAVSQARAEGARESHVEIAHGLRHAPVRVSRLVALDDRDFPAVDDDLAATPITDPSRADELPEAGCDLPDLKVYLHDPNARLEEIARMALDACEREKHARSFAEIRAAERDKLLARDLFVAAVNDTVAVNQHARMEA